MAGFVFPLRNEELAWRFVKQTILTLSTFEVELCTLDTSGIKTKQLRDLVSKIPLVNEPIHVIFVHYDNHAIK